MRVKHLLPWGLVGLVLLLQSSCEEPTTPNGGQDTTLAGVTNIWGVVLRSDVPVVLGGAVVRDTATVQADTTDANGAFRLTYTLEQAETKVLVASRSGFQSETLAVALVPGADTSIVLRMDPDPTGGGGGGGGGAYTGQAANIVLLSADELVISIRGTGGNETATLLFEVRDSLGLPVQNENSVPVSFSLSGGPGAGEYVFPAVDTTDPGTGQVSTKITSGTSAGVVQVYAQIIVGTTVIRSRPVRVLIAGGFPDPSRFSLSAQTFNMPAVFDNIENDITAAVADKDGNPVENAAVYFSTTAGDIDPGGVTTETGRITVKLRTSGTRPSNGIATVSARTVGDNGQSVSASADIVFSEATQVTGPTSFIVIADSGEYQFDYNVQDQHGNPLSKGTAIAVTVTGDGSGELELTGEKDVTIPDTQDPTYTSFSVRVRDKRTGGAFGPISVVVKVTSPNGNVTQVYSGIVLGAGSSVYVPPSAREPAQIETGSPSRTEIDVSGVGGIENSVITYTVKDSVGVPFDAGKRVFVSFEVQFSPNSFTGVGTPPSVTPAGDSTDNAGRVRATIVSGTQAGVLQVIARVLRPGKSDITSEPARIVVRAGFPVQSHFAMATDGYVFAMPTGGYGPIFTVQVADTFSNPVPTGTGVYFHSWAGNIQAAAFTNADGRAGVIFLGGPPFPTQAPNFAVRPGVFYVVSHVIGKGGTLISDSLRVCWAVGPITVTGLPAATVGVPQQGTSADINLSITDGRSNPLPVGTTITTSVEFTTDLSGIKFAVIGDLSSDVAFVMPNGSYIVDPGNGVTDFTIRVTDLSSSGGAPVGQLMIVKLKVNAPNIAERNYTFPAVIQ